MPDSQPGNRAASSLRDDVSAAISGMMYISESEAPLELLAWSEVRDLPSLQQAVEERLKVPASEQSVIGGAEFLAGIRRMADPADPVMIDYAKQYEALFELLASRSPEIVVVRAGKTEVQLFIAAFGEQAVIIQTKAIET